MKKNNIRAVNIIGHNIKDWINGIKLPRNQKSLSAMRPQFGAGFGRKLQQPPRKKKLKPPLNLSCFH